MTALLIDVLLGISGKIFSSSVFDKVLRKTTIIVLQKLVKSTHNEVDDELVEPILEALREP